MLADIENCPTRISELVPLLASAERHHVASGLEAGGVLFSADHLVPREGFENQPVVWQLKWPQHIIDCLVTSANPSGTISDSDLELAGGLLHLEALPQTFNIRERTVLSKTDNLNTLFCSGRAALLPKRSLLICSVCLESTSASTDMSRGMTTSRAHPTRLPMLCLVF